VVYPRERPLRHSSAPAPSDLPFWLESLFGVVPAAYALVGPLMVSRRPDNAVGWLLCATGLAIAASTFTRTYASYARDISLPGAQAAGFLFNINPGVAPAIFVVLLFPDGRPPSPRWRPVVWLAGAQIALVVVMGALRSGGADPLGIELPAGVFKALSVLDTVLLVGIIVGAVASVAFRLRRAHGDERQQIKWFIYAVSVIGAGGLASVLLPSPWSDVFWGVTLLGFGAVPVAVGIAILKYRLYDIDIVINRTLVYGTLTALLGMVYFGGVAATQAIFRALTGQEEQPQLAIVVSTLVIAALFNQLRRRIQGFIDRRFYRRKCDARKTLEAFSVRLRDETDLDPLNAELVRVVRETMQPAHVFAVAAPRHGSKGRAGRLAALLFIRVPSR
jgi:hypothetical protein